MLFILEYISFIKTPSYKRASESYPIADLLSPLGMLIENTDLPHEHKMQHVFEQPLLCCE